MSITWTPQLTDSVAVACFLAVFPVGWLLCARFGRKPIERYVRWRYRRRR